MDEFKISVAVAILLSLIALGFISYVASDAIQGAKIPDAEYGIVVSKGLVENGDISYYAVTLENNKILYILNNSTLYDSIKENSNYLFTCHIDYLKHMTIIDSTLQVNRTGT